MAQRGRGTDLGHAVWTKPVSLWHLRELGSQAVHVAAAVAAIAQQQALVVVALLANLARLDEGPQFSFYFHYIFTRIRNFYLLQ